MLKLLYFEKCSGKIASFVLVIVVPCMSSVYCLWAPLRSFTRVICPFDFSTPSFVIYPFCRCFQSLTHIWQMKLFCDAQDLILSLEIISCSVHSPHASQRTRDTLLFSCTNAVRYENSTWICSEVHWSRLTDLTLDMWTPKFLWMPAHRMQIKTPRFQEAHLGPDNTRDTACVSNLKRVGGNA